MPASAVIKRQAVRIVAEPRPVGTAAHATAPAPAAGGEPQVSLVREGDAVTAIEIACPCGRHVVLDCLYEDPSEGGAS